MTVLDVVKDPDALTMTFTADFDASVDRVWQLWADPRQLERWWGPPEWPATFTRHDMVVGGESAYYMTGPEGEKMRGWWRITLLDEPHRLGFDDGFANDDGSPNHEMPVIRGEMTLEELPDGRTLMTSRSWFSSAEAFEQLAEMGMEEGMRSAMGQMDAILADG